MEKRWYLLELVKHVVLRCFFYSDFSIDTIFGCSQQRKVRSALTAIRARFSVRGNSNGLSKMPRKVLYLSPHRGVPTVSAPLLKPNASTGTAIVGSVISKLREQHSLH